MHSLVCEVHSMVCAWLQGKGAEALVVYKAALAAFGGKRPKLEQKISALETELAKSEA